MILVQTESEQIFRMYFNPKLFRRVRTHEQIRGIRDTMLIRLGRWWLTSCGKENDYISELCRAASIPIIEMAEPLTPTHKGEG